MLWVRIVIRRTWRTRCPINNTQHEVSISKMKERAQVLFLSHKIVIYIIVILGTCL
jgi:hypothetical protein